MDGNNSSDDGDDPQRPTEDPVKLNRRSVLMLAGATAGTTAMAGCSSGETVSGAVETQVRYGFGGVAVLVSATSSALVSAGEAEPNDACADATAIETDTTVSGTLQQATVDWFAVELTAGDRFDIVFSRVPSDGVTNLVVSGPGCTFKTLRQVGTGQEVRVSATADETGTHYVEIVDIEEGSGDYSVRVDTDPTTTPTPTPTPTSTPTPVDEYGEQGYGEYGFGGSA
jgi:hypothetical protein